VQIFITVADGMRRIAIVLDIGSSVILTRKDHHIVYQTEIETDNRKNHGSVRGIKIHADNLSAVFVSVGILDIIIISRHTMSSSFDGAA